MDMMNVIESWNQIKNGEWEKPKNLYSRTTQSQKTATIFSLRTVTLQVIKYFKLSLCFTKKHFIVSMKTHWRYWQQISSNKMAWFHVSRYCSLIYHQVSFIFFNPSQMHISFQLQTKQITFKQWIFFLLHLPFFLLQSI